MSGEEESAPNKPESSPKETASASALGNRADLLRAITGLLWLVAVVVAGVVLFKAIAPAIPGLLANVESLSLGSEWAHVEVKFRELTEPSSDPRVLKEAELKPLQARAKQVAPKIEGKRILWVDEHFPSANEKEIAVLTGLGFTIDTVTKTDTALAELDKRGYDLLITNMLRDGDNFAGVKLLDKMCATHIYVPGIIYTWGFDTATGVPLNAVGVAFTRARMFQLIFDIAELGFPKPMCLPNSCTADTMNTPACQLSKRFSPSSAPVAASTP